VLLEGPTIAGMPRHRSGGCPLEVWYENGWRGGAQRAEETIILMFSTRSLSRIETDKTILLHLPLSTEERSVAYRSAHPGRRRRAKADTIRNSSTKPRSVVSAIAARQIAGWKMLGSCLLIGFGRVIPWNAGIFCQKWFSIAFGGEWRLCVRRCISPPVITSIRQTK
jgi:hypothetical protein